jgi:hypothetical protein
MNDIAYGGFIVSKNVLAGMPIRYTYREKSNIPQCNGWTILSPKDDQDYIRNPQNFEIVSASTIATHNPLMLELFDCPYGTDLMWVYNKGIHVGFYDLVSEREVTLKELIKRKKDSL